MSLNNMSVLCTLQYTCLYSVLYNPFAYTLNLTINLPILGTLNTFAYTLYLTIHLPSLCKLQYTCMYSATVHAWVVGSQQEHFLENGTRQGGGAQT